MKKAVLDITRCDRSPFCPAKRVCPTGAIIQVEKGFTPKATIKIINSKCIGCSKCVVACGLGAISMQ